MAAHRSMVRTFDGVLASGRYGWADPYEQWDVNAIVGKIWGGTSAYVSYSHSENNMLRNGDRDFYRVIDWPTGREVGLNCDNPNVRVTVSPRVPATGTTPEIPAVLGYFGVSADGVLSRTVSTSTTVPVVNGGISSPNLCTLDAYASAVAAAKRDNVMATFSHDFSDALELTVRGRWSKTRTTSLRAPFNTTLTARPTNPYYQNLTGTPYAGQNQTVLASFGPAFGNDDNLTTVDIEGWGISPELRWEISSGWQLRVNTSFDRTKTKRWQQEYNAAAITAATSASATSVGAALNPYNVEASDPAVLASIRNWERRGESFNEIINARAVLDGALFELPGGAVRLAVGAEYLRDHFGRRNSVEGVPGFFTAVDGNGNRLVPLLEVTRDTKSVFGEVSIPIFSEKNELPLLHELRLSLQGRYDSYSDFGNTFNPRIGANWSPTKWLTFRGNWGTTFRAPSVIDSLGTEFLQGSARSLSQFTFLVSPDPAVPAPPAGAMAIIYDAGVFPGLEPQTGTNWSVGAEINPFSGFRASVSYYHITYENQFGAAVGNSPYSGANATPPYAPTVPGSVVLYPDAATANAYIDAASNAATIRQQLGCGTPAGCAPIYMLFDLRTRNLAAVSYVGGIDYSLRYATETGFGSLFVNVSGNLQTKNSRRTTLTSPISDQLAGSLHRVSTTIGAQYGEHLRAQVTWNRTDGYDRPTITANNNGQTHIDSFNVFNFFASWDVKGQGLGSDLQFTLGIDNVFNADPPQNRTNGSVGYINGNTLGRLIQIGASKKF
jgi:iron complex outermembrane receptor protein